ncbi:MAG: hypothetical protein K7J47_14030 [Acidobacteria bacterium]|jgi:hypothetical protein|nr:hypothetical protein [Bryobacteraceae bacterium CoA2 C42]
MPALKTIRKTFDKNLESARLLFEVATKFSDPSPENQPVEPPVSAGEARRIAALAFLIMVRACQEFVEQTLIRYLAGASAPSGYRPTLLHPVAASLAEAHQRAAAPPDGLGGGQGYLSVSNWNAVQKCARQRFSEGHPFTRLTGSQQQHLAAAIRIRNRIAHSSLKCRREFLDVVNKHDPDPGQRPRGYTVGHLLLKIGNRGFGKAAAQQRFFLHYHDQLVAMADTICPAAATPLHSPGDPS